MRRRRGWVAIGVAAVLALAVWAWRRSIPDGFVVEVRARDDGTALAVLRHNEDSGPARYWLVLLGRDGDARGWAALDAEIETSSGSPTLALDGDVVMVRGIAAGRDVVEAYALPSLTPGWRTDLGAAPGRLVPDLGLYLAGEQLYAPRDLGDGDGQAAGSVVVALDPASGAERWRAELPVEVMGVSAPRIIGASVVFVAGGGSVALERETGSVVRRFDLGGLACASSTGRVASMSAEGFVEAVPGSSDRLLLPRAEIQAHAPDGVGAGHRCGSRDGRHVFTPISFAWTGLVGVDEAGTRPAWWLTLPSLNFQEIVQGRPTFRWPEQTPLTGSLTRYVPFVVEPAEPVDEPTGTPCFLAVADLDAHRLVSLSAGSPMLLHYGIVTVDGRHYVATSSEIAVVDGATGELGAAVHVEGWNREWVAPTVVAGGRLWLVGSDWAGVHELPVAILDATTLAPITVRGEISVAQNLDAARARLLGPAPPEAPPGTLGSSPAAMP